MGLQDRMKEESEQAKQKGEAAAGKATEEQKSKAEDQAKAAGQQAKEKAAGELR